MKLFFARARSLHLVSIVLAVSCAATTAACSGSSEGGIQEGPKPAPTDTTPTEPPTGQTSSGEPGKPTPPPAPPPKKTSATPPLRAGIDPAVLATLTAAGFDLAQLPDTLEGALTSRAKVDAVMKSFTQSLGVGCDGCHAKSGTAVDFRAETPNKNVARKMWTDFVRALQQADGTALYCDSCHQGKAKFLDRSDADALSTWMGENFVAKLTRRDGSKQACASCHGTPFDGDILATWAK